MYLSKNKLLQTFKNDFNLGLNLGCLIHTFAREKVTYFNHSKDICCIALEQIDLSSFKCLEDFYQQDSLLYTTDGCIL